MCVCVYLCECEGERKCVYVRVCAERERIGREGGRYRKRERDRESERKRESEVKDSTRARLRAESRA